MPILPSSGAQQVRFIDIDGGPNWSIFIQPDLRKITMQFLIDRAWTVVRLLRFGCGILAFSSLATDGTNLRSLLSQMHPSCWLCAEAKLPQRQTSDASIE